jgi:hypothetical protein
MQHGEKNLILPDFAIQMFNANSVAPSFDNVNQLALQLALPLNVFRETQRKQIAIALVGILV